MGVSNGFNTPQILVRVIDFPILAIEILSGQILVKVNDFPILAIEILSGPRSNRWQRYSAFVPSAWRLTTKA